jgi:hypothetical protein
LDEASVIELEKLLSIPLDTLALRVLELEHYSALIGFLPWANQREVAMNMLKAVDNVGSTPRSVKEITELFGVIEPVMRDEQATIVTLNQDSIARASTLMAGLGVQTQTPYLSFSDSDTGNVKDTSKENSLVSKLVHLLDHEDPDTLFEMLNVAKTHICYGGRHRASQTLVAVVFASVKLARRLFTGPTVIEKVPDANAMEVDASTQQGEYVTSEIIAKEETKTVEDVSAPAAEGVESGTCDTAETNVQTDTATRAGAGVEALSQPPIVR